MLGTLGSHQKNPEHGKTLQPPLSLQIDGPGDADGSVFNGYEANLCPKVFAVPYMRVELVRVAGRTECEVLVRVRHRIVLDVLRQNSSGFQKNSLKGEKEKSIWDIRQVLRKLPTPSLTPS